MGLPWPTVQKILFAIMVLGFGTALLGLIGTLRGWWNPIGETLMGVGTAVGALAGITSLIGGATSDEVQDVATHVRRGNQMLESVDEKMDSQSQILRSVDKKMDSQSQVLRSVDEKMDTQTDALTDQIEILGEIRDRL